MNEKILLKSGRAVSKELTLEEAKIQLAPKIKQKELDFLAYAMKSHLNLLEKGLSAAWENSLDEESRRGMQILRKVRYGGDNFQLSSEELQFLELAVSEHCDWCDEDVAKPCSASAHGERIVGWAILKKLRIFFCSAPANEKVMLLEDDTEDEMVFPANIVTKTMKMLGDFFRYDRTVGKNANASSKRRAPINGQLGLTDVFGYSEPIFRIVG